MALPELLLITFVAALITDLATGLGALPFYFTPSLSQRVTGALLGLAGGMMTTASVMQLLGEAASRTSGLDIWEVGAGMLAGVAFFSWTARYVEENEWIELGDLRKRGGVGALLIVAAMTIHSLPEGIAIGVAYGTAGETGAATFGGTVALALAVHNIPEGVAITAALRGKGVSTTRCVGWAILSSVPQPLAAVPAAWLVWVFQPLLPAGLGFAGAAMMFLVLYELMPESVEKIGRTGAAWSFSVGLVVMVLLSQVGGELGH